MRQELSRPLVDEFFAWLKAQAARVSRKSDLGEAMAYMLKRQDGFRVPGLARPHRGPRSPSLIEDGRVDIDSNLPSHRYSVSTAGQRYENAIRSPAMNRRNALFAPSRDFGPAKTLPGNGP